MRGDTALRSILRLLITAALFSSGAFSQPPFLSTIFRRFEMDG